MAVPVEKISQSKELSSEEQALVDHIGEILAAEYVSLLRKEESDESSDLCPVLKRESERAKH